MSVSKTKRQKIQQAIRAKHCSYSCIAERYGVDIEEVRRIAKPIQQQLWQKRKAKRELERMVSGSKYDRKPYQSTCKTKEYDLLTQVVGFFLLICLLAIIVSVVIGAFRLVLGV